MKRMISGWLLPAWLVLGCGLGDFEDAVPDEEMGPKAVILQMDGSFPGFKSHGGFLPTVGQSQFQFEKTLLKAAQDPVVQEIVIAVGHPTISYGRASELAAVIKQAASFGKPLSCHVDNAGNLQLWLTATACPRTTVSPAGGIDALGFAMEAIYVKELLDSFGVGAEMLHVGKYKDAAEPLTRKSMSPESRESAQSLLAELYRLFLDGIAEGRGIDRGALAQIIESGPYDAQEAVEHKLLDEVLSLGEIYARLSGKYIGGIELEYDKPKTKSPSFMDLMRMLSGAQEQDKSSTQRIALMPVIGTIVGTSADGPMDARQQVSDDELVSALHHAMFDESVAAVVLRIDSPGGSVIASDNIWSAVRAVAGVKPVIASMGDVAASGGYYIASAATEILAEPTTITGSIGVVGGKFVFSEAAQKYGLGTESLSTSDRALLNSPFKKFSAEERAVIQRLMRRYYDLFVNRIVEAREITRDEVLAAAEGRVWTGSQALELKLIDRFGGLQSAAERARTLAGVGKSVPLEIFPHPKNMMEVFAEAIASPDTSASTYLSKMYPQARFLTDLAQLLKEGRVAAYSPWLFELH